MIVVNECRHEGREETDHRKTKEHRGTSQHRGKARKAQPPHRKKGSLAKKRPLVLHIRVTTGKPKEVSIVRYHRGSTSSYPVCPTCGYAMEREYQRYCEECGQQLMWHKFYKNDVIVQEVYGKNYTRTDPWRRHPPKAPTDKEPCSAE